MTQPIQRNQNISTEFQPVQETTKAWASPSKDTLMRIEAQTSQGLSDFFSKICGSIKHFFQAIAAFFTRRPQPQPTPFLQQLNDIQLIANQRRFLWFYEERTNPITAFLGNFHPCPVTVEGVRYACAESAYQAGKFTHRSDLISQFKNLNGEQAFRHARSLASQQHPNWRTLNMSRMREVVYAKFHQNEEARQLLLATGSAYLVEHSDRDAFWGDHKDGTGLNCLGTILMEVRARLGGTAIVPQPQEYHQFIRNGGRV